MNNVVYVMIVVFANQLESMRVETDEIKAKKLFIELFNKWIRSETKLETYDECIDYQMSKAEDDESEFDDLLITFEEVVIC